VSERFLFTELIVFIKGSEPDAFFLAQILTITAGLFRRRIPQELPPPALPVLPGYLPQKRNVDCLFRRGQQFLHPQGVS